MPTEFRASWWRASERPITITSDDSDLEAPPSRYPPAWWFGTIRRTAVVAVIPVRWFGTNRTTAVGAVIPVRRFGTNRTTGAMAMVFPHGHTQWVLRWAGTARRAPNSRTEPLTGGARPTMDPLSSAATPPEVPRTYASMPELSHTPQGPTRCWHTAKANPARDHLGPTPLQTCPERARAAEAVETAGRKNSTCGVVVPGGPRVDPMGRTVTR